MSRVQPATIAETTPVFYRTGRLVVADWNWRTLSPQDCADLASQLRDILNATVTRFLPETMQVRDGAFDAFAWAGATARNSEVCTIRRQRDGILAGLLILDRKETPDRCQTIHVGYLFGEAFWGKGYATETIRGFLEWSSENNICGEIIGGVEDDNRASAAVLLKAGFREMQSPAFGQHMYSRILGGPTR